jgi:hypothetical protein
VQLPRDLDRLARKHELRGLEPNRALRGADLGLDDVDGQILLLATDQAGDAIPDARRALVGVSDGARHPGGLCTSRRN